MAFGSLLLTGVGIDTSATLPRLLMKSEFVAGSKATAWPPYEKLKPFTVSAGTRKPPRYSKPPDESKGSVDGSPD